MFYDVLSGSKRIFQIYPCNFSYPVVPLIQMSARGPAIQLSFSAVFLSSPGNLAEKYVEPSSTTSF
jgi:hypothetical protein